MWNYPDAGGWWAMGLVMVIWLVVIAAVVWLIVRAVSGRSSSGSESAEELLRRRFASGEIDTDEYQRRLEVLRRRA